MARRNAKLGFYRSRRDFRRTPEPRGGRPGGPALKKNGNPIFVIQAHDASSLHWDFRLEVDGVLKSWAVPKGPSTDPRKKRLAVATEDHPLEYADFEGVIPEDAYGGGSVIVWDAGPYEAIHGAKEGNGQAGGVLAMRDALERGRVEVWLEGRKLRGGYALIHSRTSGDERNWLLVKMKDEGADARRNPTRTQPESVVSGRTLEEVAEEEGRADDGDGR
ncbi:MAG: DNA polymerase ligase N-terminal domain-containing protein [Myxococcota bacterium]